MQNKNGHSGGRELFRYANVKAPRILDLEARLKKFPAGRSLSGKSGKEKAAAAREIIKPENYIDSTGKLSFDYFGPLKIDDVPEKYLPTRETITDTKNFKSAVSGNIQKINTDIQNVSLSLYAAIALGDDEGTGRLSRLLQFIELYPSLDKTSAPLRYAPVVTRRFSPKLPSVENAQNDILPLKLEGGGGGRLASRQVLVLWDAVNKFKSGKERSVEQAMEEINRRKFEPVRTGGKASSRDPSGGGETKTGAEADKAQAKKQTGGKKKQTPGQAISQRVSQTADQSTRQSPEQSASPGAASKAPPGGAKPPPSDEKNEEARINAEKFREFTENKRKELSALRKEREKLKSLDGPALIPEMLRDEDFLEKNIEVKEAIEAIRESDGEPLEKKVQKHTGFPELYEEARRRESATVSIRHEDCDLDIDDPCVKQFAADRHRITGKYLVRPLGEADLIVVEENWLRYTPGEISAVETVLKNEKRVKVVKTEATFETLSESLSEEVTEKEAESKSTTGNELSSQIENEISSRFASDINSSVSGSGGGTIGVVNFKGEGSLGTSVGIGLDTSFKSSESSNFSSEIISRALEKTKKTTTERRLSRTLRKFETSHTHEIDNTGTNSGHVNGIYCYLDKHICITERQYGIRQFFIADVNFPGRELLVREMQKYILNLNEVGLPPVFDIGPSDIDEYNYLSLVGRYRAFNVQTPPPVVKMESRTYKTDTSNESKIQGESKLRDVADVLVPFFGQYKRFLIQDNIEIPEGYQVQEVRVTVTHGSNGVSIPAHLPFSLGGALIYAMPKLAISSIPIYTLFYLPIALTEIMYLASPVLHYNADSSNCTINIGHETKESPYFFFQPEELLLKITNLVAGFPQLSGSVVSQIMAALNKFLADMPGAINQQLVEGFQGTFNDVVAKLRELMDILQVIAKPLTGPDLPVYSNEDAEKIKKFFIDGFQSFKDALKNASMDMQDLMKPLKDLIDELKDIIQTELLQSFFDELQNLFSTFENSDYREFSGMKGLTETLPVSFNCIALKPGVTINLTAVMVRSGDASLNAWRMETFDRLNQAWYQMDADYQARLLMKNGKDLLANPGLMRQEEQRVIKDRVIRSLLELYPSTQGNVSDLDRLLYPSLKERGQK